MFRNEYFPLDYVFSLFVGTGVEQVGRTASNNPKTTTCSDNTMGHRILATGLIKICSEPQGHLPSCTGTQQSLIRSHCECPNVVTVCVLDLIDFREAGATAFRNVEDV